MFLRLQFAQISGEVLSSKDNKFKEAVKFTHESGISNAQSSSGLTPFPQSAFLNNNSSLEKAGSLSASADDFLTNVVNMDGSSLTSSANVTTKSPDNIPETVETEVDKTESEEKTEAKDVKGKDEIVAGEFERAEEELQVEPFSAADAYKKPEPGKASPEPSLAVERNSPCDSAFNKQHDRFSKIEVIVIFFRQEGNLVHILFIFLFKMQNTGTGKEAELGCLPQLGSLQNFENQGNCGELTDAQCLEAGQNKMQHDQILKVLE